MRKKLLRPLILALGLIALTTTGATYNASAGPKRLPSSEPEAPQTPSATRKESPATRAYRKLREARPASTEEAKGTKHDWKSGKVIVVPLSEADVWHRPGAQAAKTGRETQQPLVAAELALSDVEPIVTSVVTKAMSADEDATSTRLEMWKKLRDTLPKQTCKDSVPETKSEDGKTIVEPARACKEGYCWNGEAEIPTTSCKSCMTLHSHLATLNEESKRLNLDLQINTALKVSRNVLALTLVAYLGYNTMKYLTREQARNDNRRP